MIVKVSFLLGLVGLFMLGCSSRYEFNYPETARVGQVDDYFGTNVADPYRWLEQDVRESKEVAEWVAAENEVTEGYLETISVRGEIKERLEALLDYDRAGLPGKHGDYYIQSVRHKMANHSTVYKLKTLGGEREELFNPNNWSKDGSVALAGLSFSEDGKLVAYGIQESGSDWRTWKIREVETGKDLPDVMENLKFTGLDWDHEGTGFYYGKYPDPTDGEKFTSLNTHMKVMYHRLGTKQADDVVVYYNPDEPTWNYHSGVTDDGRFLLVVISIGTDDRYKVLCKNLQEEGSEFVELVGEFKNSYRLVGNDGDVLYFMTDYDAPRYRVIAMDVKQPGPEHWTEIIAEADETLDNVSLFGDAFFCRYLKDVKTQVKIFDKNGAFVKDLALPGAGTAGGFGGKREAKETFYAFQTFTMPPSIYRYDLESGESTLIERVDVDMDPDAYVTEQIFYPSKDGTKVPMYVSYKKGTKLDGTAPTILYGYGGFGISMEPGYSTGWHVWMDMGGIAAIANLRGGGEYGKAWHEAGKLFKKQNVYDDFFAAAEYLIGHDYCSSKTLGIMGGSNGGLLVGACMTQRPELFGAAVPAVGVMDMLRFDEFTAGRFWVDEYGSSKDSKEMFEYLLGYSPYHTIKAGVDYPATLVKTADTDDRVVPAHSFKFIARLQHLYKGNKPMLIRIQTKAGHGSGKPIRFWIDETADTYGFLLEELKP